MDVYAYALAFVAIIGVVWTAWSRVARRKTTTTLDPAISALYKNIEPLEDFDLWSTDQIQNASFRNTYHLTMALQTCSMSELIDMDKTYRDQILLRRQIIEEQGNNVVGCNPIATAAVYELYNYIFGAYLPKRYPSMFVMVETEKRSYTLNRVMKEEIPLVPIPTSATECLSILGSHIDTDFSILLPSNEPYAHDPPRAEPTSTPPHPYHLHAFSLIFPAGFNTLHKLGLSLAGIHTPVPGYAQKLEKSMDRFFNTLPFGKIVRRSNWTVQQDNAWFKLAGNHGYTSLAPTTFAPPTHDPSEDELKQWAEDAEKVEPEKCMLRSERQTLHRLEKTGALVFAFKTFMYPLSDIKVAGLGPEMADAAEGLWLGSVPAMAVYKRGVVWAKKVTEYLRTDDKANYCIF